MRKKIYHFTNIPSHYRTNLWAKLISSKEFDFHFFYGTNTSLKIKEIDFNSDVFKQNNHKLKRIKNFWLKGKILIWQSGVVKKCLVDRIDVAIFLGEFQVISTWLAVIVCKIRGVKSVFWTHGLYGNESKFKKILRVSFYKMADELLLYERRAKKLLIAEGLNEKKLKVIFNSLDYDQHKKLREANEIKGDFKTSFFSNNNLPYLIFVGRLTKVKKLDILINALEKINKDKKQLNLLFIGDGDEKQTLIKLVKELNLQSHVHFYGACYDEILLAKFIYHASLCVSPGNIGLTAIHALSFGTPVCTHNNFYNQMPEVEVIEEGTNGIFFNENNVSSLVTSINKWLNSNTNREETRMNCYQIIDKYYNPSYQEEVISTLV